MLNTSGIYIHFQTIVKNSSHPVISPMMELIKPIRAIRPEMVLNAQFEVNAETQPPGIMPNQDSNLTGKPTRNLTPNVSARPTTPLKFPSH